MAENSLIEHFEGMEQSAANLSEYAEQQRELYSRIKNVMNSLPDSYKGAASSALMENFKSKDNYFTNFAMQIEGFADYLKKTVAEEREREAAKAREASSAGGNSI